MNRRQHDGSIIQVPSVPVVKSYNNNMGGVDLSDQLRGYYMTGRKSKKWCHILEKLSPRHRNRTLLAFRLDLIKNLIGDFSARKLSASSVRITWCRMACELCDKRICLDCFRNHTAEDLV